jgi:hypothetical protein
MSCVWDDLPPPSRQDDEQRTVLDKVDTVARTMIDSKL